MINLVCHERWRCCAKVVVVGGGAVQLMKVGTSESPCMGRLHTTPGCAGREARVVSDEEKAPVRCQVETRKANVCLGGDGSSGQVVFRVRRTVVALPHRRQPTPSIAS